MGTEPIVGRPRDRGLDDAILTAALDVLGEGGFDALSFSAVADRAGTTRPAIYRRYATRADLAVAALGSLSRATVPARTGDHLVDLTAELTAFRDAIEAAQGIALVATALQASADPEVIDRYRQVVVAPRRARLAAILDDAHRAGSLDAPPRDRANAVTMCTGSWYAWRLAGEDPPRDWPRRTAALVWRSLGGQP